MFIEEVVVFRNCGIVIDYLACQIGSITSIFPKTHNRPLYTQNAFIFIIVV